MRSHERQRIGFPYSRLFARRNQLKQERTQRNVEGNTDTGWERVLYETLGMSAGTASYHG